MGMSLAHGGHLTHGSPVNLSGKNYHFVPYGVGPDGYIDYAEMRRIALECRPKLIVAGASAYPRAIAFNKIAEIAQEVGAYFMVDMAHIAGLVAAGLHQSPVPYADIVTSTTHKTLRGPRGGLILCKAELAAAVNKAVFPGTQGGPLEHIILLNLIGTGVTGKELEQRLDAVHITANKNAVPNDPEKPFVTSGVRLGTPAATTRGFKEPEMVQIADLITLAIRDFEAQKAAIAEKVEKMCAQYPLYQ